MVDVDDETTMSEEVKEEFTGDMLPGIGPLEEILTIIGLLYAGKVIIYALWDLLVGFRAHVWSRLWKKRLVEKYGKWAVVTGSTDGIGKEYARQLAKDGMNIVLVSRTMEKLQKVSAEIVEESGVEIEIVKADFLDGRIIYDDIAKHLENKEIGILVNNVGVMLPNPMDFRCVADREIWSHVNVNVASVPAMTKLVLPSMISRGKGAIINIASIAASGPIPLMGIYAASKTFVDYFSQALEWECRGTGITVQTVNPGYVSTNMTSMSDLIHRPGILIPTARTFVTHALSTLGYTARTSGYWVHGIQTHFVQNFISTWVFKYCMYLFNCLIVKNLKKNQENPASESRNTPDELRNTPGETNIQAEPKDVPGESKNKAEEPRSAPVEPRSSPTEPRNLPEELKNAPTEQRNVPAEPGRTGHDLDNTGDEESR